LALATARLRQGASTEAIDALPPLEISLSPDVAAARAFSRTIRWYSAGEHLFCAISSVRRAIVSHDAIIRSVTIIGSDTVLRRLRAVITSASPDDECGRTLPNVGRSDQFRSLYKKDGWTGWPGREPLRAISVLLQNSQENCGSLARGIEGKNSWHAARSSELEATLVRPRYGRRPKADPENGAGGIEIAARPRPISGYGAGGFRHDNLESE
jgi:hypothetical protein